MGIDTSPSIKSFILKPWIWHFMVTLTFAIILLAIVRVHYSDRSATRIDFLMNLASLPLVWTHTVLILIFSMRRFAKKQAMPGLIYFVHFILSAGLGFYAYMMMAAGWLYAMKG